MSGGLFQARVKRIVDEVMDRGLDDVATQALLDQRAAALTHAVRRAGGKPPGPIMLRLGRGADGIPTVTVAFDTDVKERGKP